MHNPVTKHLLVMAAHLVTPDPTVAQFHTQVRGGGVEVTAPIKPLQAAVVAVDNSPEATCSTHGAVSSTDRWLQVYLLDSVL